MSFAETDLAYRRVFRLVCILLDRMPLDEVFKAFADAEWEERNRASRHEFKMAELLGDGGASLYCAADKLSDLLMNNPERIADGFKRMTVLDQFKG